MDQVNEPLRLSTRYTIGETFKASTQEGIRLMDFFQGPVPSWVPIFMSSTKFTKCMVDHGSFLPSSICKMHFVDTKKKLQSLVDIHT